VLLHNALVTSKYRRIDNDEVAINTNKRTRKRQYAHSEKLYFYKSKKASPNSKDEREMKQAYLISYSGAETHPVRVPLMPCTRLMSVAVATRGSVLYFLIVTMSNVNCMYQTSLRQFLRLSLRQFLQLFDIAMTRSNRSPFTTRRIQNIIDYLTYLTFSYTTRGLYEADKFLFTILMTLQVQMEAKAISQEEFQCFIKGAPLCLRT